MTQKTLNLIKGIALGVETISIALVTYLCEPGLAAGINASIIIAVNAGLEICEQFVEK